MKRILIIFSILTVVGVCGIIYAQTTSRKEARVERHKEREQRRAERLAAYERYIDSLVLSRNFQFNPQSMQQQPAGPVRQIMNPNFDLAVWGDNVDICLPYVKGVTPPYYFVILNYSLTWVDKYFVEQTSDGWLVSLSTSLFSVNTYQFSLEIYSSSGGATLTVSSTWYPAVQYWGSITNVN